MKTLAQLAVEGAYSSAIRWLAVRRLGAAVRLTMFATLPGRSGRVRIRIERDWTDG